jgi:hypothetical protein
MKKVRMLPKHSCMICSDMIFRHGCQAEKYDILKLPCTLQQEGSVAEEATIDSTTGIIRYRLPRKSFPA